MKSEKESDLTSFCILHFTFCIFHFLPSIPKRLLIGLVRLYQWSLSPMLGRRCRFEPSCSEYFIESVRKYGLIRGAWRGLRRIGRCHPWSPGGYDPP